MTSRTEHCGRVFARKRFKHTGTDLSQKQVAFLYKMSTLECMLVAVICCAQLGYGLRVDEEDSIDNDTKTKRHIAMLATSGTLGMDHAAKVEKAAWYLPPISFLATHLQSHEHDVLGHLEIVTIVVFFVFVAFMLYYLNAPQKKSAESVDEVVALLANLHVMQHLDPKLLQVLAQTCEKVKLRPGDIVFKQGAPGTEFYLILEGTALVHVQQNSAEDEHKRTMSRGQYFGEKALLSNEPRTATVSAEENLTLLVVSGEKFAELGLQTKLHVKIRQNVIKRKTEAMDQDVMRFSSVKSSKKEPAPKVGEEKQLLLKLVQSNDSLMVSLGNLSEECLLLLIESALKQKVSQGEIVMKVGDKADNVYIIHEGQFELSQENEQFMRKLEKGDCFGELAFLLDNPSTVTVRAATDATLWVLCRKTFNVALKGQAIGKMNEYADLLNSIKIFDSKTQAQKLEAAYAFSEKTYVKDEMIFEQGEEGDSFYILLQGSVAVIQDGSVIKSLTADRASDTSESFGELALTSAPSRTCSIQVSSDEAEVISLDRGTFDMLFGDLKWSKYEHVQIEYEELTRLGLLGKGSFGAVALCEHTPTKDKYALKMMNKAFIVKSGTQETVVNERRLLGGVRSLFICRVYGSYNWPNELGLLLEALLGGDLEETYMKQCIFGSEPHTKYYAACCALGLDHLQAKAILYRDLKPANVLLDERGIPKLADFGLAKRSVGKTFTTCGTPEYLAPETIRGMGHDSAVDWWAWGVVVFELMSGTTPFRADSLMGICKKIARGYEKVPLPSKIHGDVQDLLISILQINPEDRLPRRRGGILNVKAHPWFTSLNWESTENGLPDSIPLKPITVDVANLDNDEWEPPAAAEPYVDDGSGWDADWVAKPA